MSESYAEFQEADGSVRMAGQLAYPQATPSDVLTVQDDGTIAAAAGGGSSAAVPLGQADGWTTDDTTYDNTLTGSGKFVTLVAASADQAVFAVAVDGDDFPRWVIDSNTGGGIFMGDGTADPINGASIYLSDGALTFSSPSAKQTDLGAEAKSANFEATGSQVDLTGIPTADPHVAGRLWVDSAADFVIKVSQG